MSILAILAANPAIISGALRLAGTLLKARELGQLPELPPEVEAELIKVKNEESAARDALIERGRAVQD